MRCARWRDWLLASSAALASLLLGLGPRLAALHREIWLDEAWQAINVVTAPDLRTLVRNTSVHATPFFDFILLKWLWDPLVGHQELGLRLPSLLYGLAAVALVALFAYRRLRTGDAPAWLAWLAAFVAGAWCAENTTQIYYSAEARTYSFAALASIVWAATWTLTPEGRSRRWRTAAASALYLQSHFFAVPMVAAAYGYEILTDLFARRRRQALVSLVIICVLVAATIGLNWAGVSKLFTFSRWAEHPPPQSAAARIGAGLALYWVYLKDLELPLGGAVVWLALSLIGVASRSARLRDASRRLAWLVLVVAPLHYTVLRISSAYFFSTRYHIPLFGIGVVIVVLGIEGLLALSARVPKLRPSKAQVGAALILVAVSVGLVRVATTQPVARSLPSSPNYTLNFQLFESLKKQPSFLLISCSGGFVPQLYRTILGAPEPATLQVTELRSDKTDWRAQTADDSALAAFLRQHPGAPVVFYDTLTQCPPRRPASMPFTVERYELGLNCAWKMIGARTAADVRQVGEQEGFPVEVAALPGCHF